MAVMVGAISAVIMALSANRNQQANHFAFHTRHITDCLWDAAFTGLKPRWRDALSHTTFVRSFSKYW